MPAGTCPHEQPTVVNRGERYCSLRTLDAFTTIPRLKATLSYLNLLLPPPTDRPTDRLTGLWLCGPSCTWHTAYRTTRAHGQAARRPTESFAHASQQLASPAPPDSARCTRRIPQIHNRHYPHFCERSSRSRGALQPRQDASPRFQDRHIGDHIHQARLQRSSCRHLTVSIRWDDEKRRQFPSHRSQLE